MSHRDIVYDFVRKHHSKFSGIEFNKDVLEEDTFTRLELFLMQRLYTEIVRAKLMFDRESESSEEQSVIFHDLLFISLGVGLVLGEETNDESGTVVVPRIGSGIGKLKAFVFA